MDNFTLTTIVTTLIGSVMGGGLTYLITLKSQKKRANGEADQAVAVAQNQEIKNVEEAITIWKQIAFDLKAEMEDLKKQNNALKCQNSQIIRMLKSITPENIRKVLDEIEKEIN